jgi:transposase
MPGVILWIWSRALPVACRYVTQALAETHHHDKIAKQQSLSLDQHIRFHQDRSDSIMKRLNEGLQKQLTEGRVEPNSSIVKAITYILKHLEPLTLFPGIPGTPLHNNLWKLLASEQLS